MAVTIIVSILVILVLAAVLRTWYRRTLARHEPADASPAPPRGTRLTAESLRDLAQPPWRVVHEIGETALDGVDHVVIGTSGAVAIRTSVGAPPDPTLDDATPHRMAAAAITRGEVDALLAGSGASCPLLAHVHWGPVDPDTPISAEIVPGLVVVDGHRLRKWLETLPPGELTPAQIDLAWQRVVTGIGRPDPLT